MLLGNIKGSEGLQDNIFEISAAVYKGEDWPDVDENLEAADRVIKAMSNVLPPLEEFIRPSGNIHLARAVCRRCERKAWALDSSKQYNKYLNRLSDYLFLLARMIADKPETQWER